MLEILSLSFVFVFFVVPMAFNAGMRKGALEQQWKVENLETRLKLSQGSLEDAQRMRKRLELLNFYLRNPEGSLGSEYDLEEAETRHNRV